MILNEYGNIVTDEWERTSVLRPNVRVADFVIMPNHIHGILVIVDDSDSRTGVLENKTDLRTGVLPYAPTIPNAPTDTGVFQYAPTEFKSPSKTIGAIIRGFKSAAATRINRLRDTPRLPVWQRNYYEHIIRDERSYERIAEYIRLNPARWTEDSLYVRR